MHPVIFSTMAVLTIVAGAIECFFGYRIFKITLGIIGFFWGGTLTVFAGSTVFYNQIILLLIGITGGIFGMLAMIWLYFLGVFFLGAMLGLVIGNFIFTAAQIYPFSLVLVIISIGCGILALFVQKYMIIFATALIGSMYMAAGITCLLNGGACLTNFEYFFKPYALHQNVMMMWFFFSLLGILVQSKILPARDGLKKTVSD